MFRLRASLLLATVSALAAGAAHAGAEGAAEVDTLVVTAPRQALPAREVQKAAPNIINVQSAEEIAKYPDFNAAEALGRMPGISLSSDTGEGRFVEIRGLDGNLNGATYGGVVLLNTNPGGTYFNGGGRAVEFDTVPTGAIDGIVVIKTGLPDHDAEGLGGTVELTPRTAVNATRPFLETTLGWGYETAHDKTGPFNAEFAAGARFGFDGGKLIVEDGKNSQAPRAGWVSNPTPFSVVITGSRRDDRRGFDDLEADYIDDSGFSATSGPAFTGQQVDKAFADIQLRRYAYHRRRFGYGGEFDFKPNDDHSYYIRAAIAGYTEQVTKNRLTYDALDQAARTDPANPTKGYAALADLTIKGTDEQEQHRNQVYAVGGKDSFGDLSLDYRAAYSRATFNVGYNIGTTFKGPKAVAITYDNISDPDFPAIKITSGVDPNNAAAYKLSKLSNSGQAALDEEWSYAVNLSAPVHLINDDDRVKFGAQARLRTKSTHSFTEAFVIPSLLLSQASNGADTSFYDGHYTNGPTISRQVIRALIAKGGGATSKGKVANLGSDFTADENIYAVYGLYTADLEHWGFLAGVRGERTEATYHNYAFNGDGDLIGPESRSSDYTNLFPTLQARYAFSPQMIARATYSTGIGRPGFNQIASATTIDFDNNTITSGNANLKPTTGSNFDLSFEYYLPEGGILQLGAFDKEFDNYVVSSRRTGKDPRLSGVVTFFSYGNISSAYARGIEAAYQQKFVWLAAPFDGLGVEANITGVDSQAEIRPGEKRLLPGTSKMTYNLAAFYEAHGLNLRLATEYVGRTLFVAGGSAGSDVFQDKRQTLDFTSSYQVTPAMNVYFNAKNLTNEPLRFYERSQDRPIQREFYEITYEAGVRAKF